MFKGNIIMSEQDIRQWKKLLDLLDTDAEIRTNAVYHVRVSISWGFQQKINNDQHIIMVKSGKGMYEIEPRDGDSVPLSLERGRLIYIGPGMKHRAEADLNDLPFITPVRFSLTDKKGRSLDHLMDVPFFMSASDISMQIFEPLFHELFTVRSLGGKGSSKTAGRLLKSILFIADSEFCGQQKFDSRFDLLRRYIYEHLNRPITLAELSAAAGLSGRQINRIFLENTGLTPRRFINRERCHLAAMLLEDRGKSVQEVAYDLGFPDPFTFSRQYKRLTGRSPSER